MSTTAQLPIFPLGTVLFPGGLLPLRVFEARYMDMARECLKTGSAFGVCLIFGVAFSVELARARNESACNAADATACRKLCSRWGSGACGGMPAASGRSFCASACGAVRP